jgi:hypothetical protein
MTPTEARKAAVTLRAEIRRKYTNICRDQTLSRLDRKAACEQLYSNSQDEMRELRAAGITKATPEEPGNDMNALLRGMVAGAPPLGDATRQMWERTVYTVPMFDPRELDRAEATTK